MTNQDGIVLTRAELLTLLDAVNADDLVGVDADALLPSDPQEHKALVDEGIDLLKKRGLLEVDNDVNVINPELFAIAQVFARPELAVLIHKEIPDLGLQRIMYYQRDLLIVEHTMPANGEFRFAIPPNTLAMFNRIELFVPVQERAPGTAYQEVLEPKAYIGVRWLVEQGRPDDAETLLNEQGWSEGASHLFAQALAAHTYAAAVAFVRVEGDQLVQAREIEVVRTDELTWLALTAANDAGQTVVKTTHREDYLVEMFNAFQSLIPQA
jgi:hypothetical protein